MSLNDEKRSKSSNNKYKNSYLDYIEFILADIETENTNKEGHKSNTIRKPLKWPDNKIVDSKKLSHYHQIVDEVFTIVQEHILLSQINRINYFTNSIPLSSLFNHNEKRSNIASSFIASFTTTTPKYDLIFEKKKSIIDMRTLKALTDDKQINWSTTINYLYPIKTLADGNCLCHAVLSYLTGMQDTNLALRETLKIFLNDPNYCHELKFRWKVNRKNFYTSLRIELDEDEMEKEWIEISNMKKTTQQSAAETATPHPASLPSLIYLEDIHVFALANLLMRPIIVISPENIGDIQQCDLRGVYLPLLKRPSECVKDPILIAYYNFHFMPLVFAMDEESGNDYKSDNEKENPMTENNYQFRNLDILDLKNLSNEEFDKMYKFSGKQKTNFLNAVPLIDFNLEQVKVHFLKEIEEKNTMKHLKNYLNLLKAEIMFNEYKPVHVEYFEEPNRPCIQIFCCFLDRDSKSLNNNGIETYLKFINESLVVGESSSETRNHIVESTSNKEFRTLTPPRVLANIIPKYTRKLCKAEGCSNYALEAKSFYGYCDICFNTRILQKPVNNYENNKLEYEINQLEAQSAKTKAEMEKLVEHNRKIEKDFNEYKNEYQSRARCSTSECTNQVRLTRFGSSKYCETCNAYNTQAKERSFKYTNMMTQIKDETSQQPSNAITLPINYEISDHYNSNNRTTNYNYSPTKNNYISAYNHSDKYNNYGNSVYDRIVKSPTLNANSNIINTLTYRIYCQICGREYDSKLEKSRVCVLCMNKNGVYF